MLTHSIDGHKSTIDSKAKVMEFLLKINQNVSVIVHLY